MLTIFAMPKAFRGQFDTIQHNAIYSWTKLRPQAEIVLLGADYGTEDLAREIGALHVPTVDRNQYGTPLASEVFRLGQQQASTDVVAYVNSDIILMSDFMEAVSEAEANYESRHFLMLGRKRNFALSEQIEFSDPTWEIRLRALDAAIGRYVTYDSDFFVFRPGLYGNMPPFAIGRCFWTQWLIYNPHRRGVPIIDATSRVRSVEPTHDYSHAASTGGAQRLSGPEYRSNRALFRGCQYFTTLDATHVMTPNGILPAPRWRKLASLAVQFDYYVYFLMKASWYPYSMPAILLGRWLRAQAAAVRNSTRGVRPGF
jgi:hypothetical protein